MTDSFEDELVETFRGERQAVTARMRAATAVTRQTAPRVEAPLVETRGTYRRVLWAFPIALVAMAFVVLGVMNRPDPSSVVVAVAGGAQPDGAATTQVADPAAVAEPSEDLVYVQLVPQFLVGGLPLPEIAEITATSLLSSNSAEVYFVGSDGAVGLPTFRNRDLFQFSAPMPGTEDCRWSSNAEPVPELGVSTETGELPQMHADFTPLCGNGARLTGTGPTHQIRVRLVTLDGDTAIPIVGSTMHQTTGYEARTDVAELPPAVDGVVPVFSVDHTSLLAVSVAETTAGGCLLTGAGLIPAFSSNSATAELVISLQSRCEVSTDNPVPSPAELCDWCEIDYRFRAGPVYCTAAGDSPEGFALYTDPDLTSTVQNFVPVDRCVLSVKTEGEWALVILLDENVNQAAPETLIGGWTLVKRLEEQAE